MLLKTIIMKNIWIIHIALMCSFAANAQPNYYANQDIVTGTNVVYHVDHSYSGSYDLSDITNTRTGEPMRLLNGALAMPPFEQYAVEHVGDHYLIAKAILEEVFTPSELLAMRNQDIDFSTEYVIDHNGNVVEVSFSFAIHPLLYSISPDKWYSIEQKIKQRMKYFVSAKAKTLQFVTVVKIWGVKYIK
jgi:hypothetical protein